MDLVAGLIRVESTKNGHPIVSMLSASAKAELASMPGRKAVELVFANKSGQPIHWRKLWLNITKEAGFDGYNFHLLGYSCAPSLPTTIGGKGVDNIGTSTLRCCLRS